MGAVQTARHPQDATPPSFESVWAVLQENAQGMKELRESQKELTESRNSSPRIFAQIPVARFVLCALTYRKN